MTSIHLDEFTIEHHGRDIWFRNDHAEMPRRPGDDAGAILFRHSVDGHPADLVAIDANHTGLLDLLDHAIETLTAARDRYTAMVPAERRPASQCVAFGDWGRCSLRSGHEVDTGGEHLFSTEEQWEAEQQALRKFPRSA